MTYEEHKTPEFVPVKRCSKCGEVSGLYNFSKDSKSADGRSHRCKPCTSEYKREYNKTNRSVIRLKKREYTLKNKELVSAQRKASHARNKERKAAYDKVRRESDKQAAYNRVAEWTKANADRVRARKRENARKRRRANPAEARAATAARRARVKQAMPRWVDKISVISIYAEAANGHVDHFHPIAGYNYSGLHVPCNLRVATAKENLLKSNKPPEEHYFLFFHYKIVGKHLVPMLSEPTERSKSDKVLLQELNEKVKTWYS